MCIRDRKRIVTKIGKFRTFSAYCIAAVSYTHLDVYKRQALVCVTALLPDVANLLPHLPAIFSGVCLHLLEPKKGKGRNVANSAFR